MFGCERCLLCGTLDLSKKREVIHGYIYLSDGSDGISGFPMGKGNKGRHLSCDERVYGEKRNGGAGWKLAAVCGKMCLCQWSAYGGLFFLEDGDRRFSESVGSGFYFVLQPWFHPCHVDPAKNTEGREGKKLKYFGIMLSVFGLDTATKIWARKKLPLGGKTEIIKDKFYFRRIKNDGMAYNTLERNPKAVLYLTGGLIGWCFASFCMMLTKQEEKKYLLLPLSVMLGGALGNFWDRIRHGGVTDFLYIKWKKAPIFNVADIAIVGGGIWGMLAALWKR